MKVPWEWDYRAKIEFTGVSSYGTFSDHTHPPKSKFSLVVGKASAKAKPRGVVCARPGAWG